MLINSLIKLSHLQNFEAQHVLDYIRLKEGHFVLYTDFFFCTSLL